MLLFAAAAAAIVAAAVVAVVVTVHLRTNPYQVFSTSTGTWHWRSYVHGWADATHRVVELRCS